MVRSTAKSTYFKELLFPFFKIFYTLIVHYVINFVFSIGKQPYILVDVINFVSYTCIHVVSSYNDINFTYLYMRTNYLRHLDNIDLFLRPFLCYQLQSVVQNRYVLL